MLADGGTGEHDEFFGQMDGCFRDGDACFDPRERHARMHAALQKAADHTNGNSLRKRVGPRACRDGRKSTERMDTLRK